MIDNSKRTIAIGFARYSNEFFECAVAADEKVGLNPSYEIIAPIPVMYLTAHSIELCLKSYLLFHGVQLEELKSNKYGHNLEKCLKEAKRLGLDTHVTIDDGELNTISVLNELYSTKQLNYLVTGEKNFPVFGSIQIVCEKLLTAICPLVGFR